MSPARAVLAGVPIGDDHPVAVMGVLNVSPESFYAGSVHRRLDDLVDAALGMVREGAVLIDVGARSTAPYLPSAIDEAEEAERLGRALEVLAAKVPVPISADTARARVAEVALAAGARVINDVSGLRDPALAALARERGVGLILMASPPAHARGSAAADAGRDPVEAVRRLLDGALQRARAAGLAEENVVLDPGIGFFRDEPVRSDEWDVAVLAGLGTLAALGRPLCVGVSRKSFVGALTGRADPAARLPGSLAATAMAVFNGAALIRTHDVGPTLDAVRVAARARRVDRR